MCQVLSEQEKYKDSVGCLLVSPAWLNTLCSYLPSLLVSLKTIDVLCFGGVEHFPSRQCILPQSINLFCEVIQLEMMENT